MSVRLGRVLAVGGSVATIAGCFAPIIVFPVGVSASLFRDGIVDGKPTDGAVIVGIAVLSLALGIGNCLRLSALFALMNVLVAALTAEQVLKVMQSGSEFTIGWGIGLLGAGLLATLISPIARY